MFNKSEEAKARAKEKLKNLNERARTQYTQYKEYELIGYGDIYEEDGKYLIEAEEEGAEDKIFSSFEEIEKFYMDLYDDRLSKMMVTEVDELYPYNDESDDPAVAEKQYAQSYDKAKRIIGLYNELLDPSRNIELHLIFDYVKKYLRLIRDNNMQYAIHIQYNPQCVRIVNLDTGKSKNVDIGELP